jgi:hypothetical protein
MPLAAIITFVACVIVLTTTSAIVTIFTAILTTVALIAIFLYAYTVPIEK